MPKVKSENSNVTIREVYQLLDQKMGEVNKSIDRLAEKFDSLESGRLSRLERDFANLQGKLIVIAFLIPITVNAIFFIVNLYLNK